MAFCLLAENTENKSWKEINDLILNQDLDYFDFFPLIPLSDSDLNGIGISISRNQINSGSKKAFIKLFTNLKSGGFTTYELYNGLEITERNLDDVLRVIF
jgi:hypothetical protein